MKRVSVLEVDSSVRQAICSKHAKGKVEMEASILQFDLQRTYERLMSS